MNKSEALQIIAAEAAEGKLTLPSNVNVALRVREVLDDPDCHADQVAVLVEADPVLSARVVAMANSPVLNSSGRTITDARFAIARVGLGTIRVLAIAEVARQLANMPAQPRHRDFSRQLWSHSVHVAALAHILARRVTRQNPDTALFAGIVHELGGLYLIFRAGDFPCLLESPSPDAGGAELLDGTGDDERERTVGRAIMQALFIPEPVSRVIEELWAGHLTMPPTSLADTLLLAEELVEVRSPLRQHLTAARSHNAVDINMVIGRETLSAILQRSAADVSSVAMALSS